MKRTTRKVLLYLALCTGQSGRFCILTVIGGKENDPFQLDGYKYAENGQNEYGCAIIIQYLDGKLNTVYPTDSASMEVVYPAKGWNER